MSSGFFVPMRLLCATLVLVAISGRSFGEIRDDGWRRRSVAVVEFDVKGDLGIPDAGAIIAEWMISELGKTRQYDLKERVLLKKILEEQQFEASGLIDDKTVAARIGKLFGVEAIVTGSVLKWGQKISVTSRLIDTSTGDILHIADAQPKTPDDIQKKVAPMALVISGLNVGKSASMNIPFFDAGVMSVRFFESDHGAPPRKNRKYRYRFPKEQSRYINWELSLEYPPPGRALNFDLIWVWHEPDGAMIINTFSNASVNATWKDSWYSSGRGWTTPGHWKPGTYRVDMYVHGRKIASDSFEVY